MPDSTAPNTSPPEITRPAAAQEVGDLAFAASLLTDLVENSSAPEGTDDLARSLEEHLRGLKRALSSRPEEREDSSAEEAPEPPADPAGDSPPGRGNSDRQDLGRGEDLNAVLRRRFRTPINPNPTSKPPLVEGAELQLSPETVETVGRAAGALDRFYHGPVSESRIADVALRKLLYGLATRREESVLAEWLGRAYGRRQGRSPMGTGDGKACVCP